MPELIERHALLKKVYEHPQERERMTDGEWCRKCIYEAPTIEPEVRHGRWIPCSERLPDHYGDILFCERDRTIHKGYMYWDGTFIENYVKYRKSDIVAWMPMPEPPET